VKAGESVALRWHEARPGDLTPVLHLLREAEKRNAFPTALSYLEIAEKIDSVDSRVRAAKSRLLLAAAMRHLQQKKPHLALSKVAAVRLLPQSAQGGLLAFAQAISCLALTDMKKLDEAAQERAALETVLESRLAATLLMHGIAIRCKRPGLTRIDPAKQLPPADKVQIPMAMAKASAVAIELGISKFSLPMDYFEEANREFPKHAAGFDVKHLKAVGAMGFGGGFPHLAWRASTAGLRLGGPSEAAFLVMRARAMPRGTELRQVVVLSAAVVLARSHGDTDAANQAVSILKSPLRDEPIAFTLEQAREILRRELASPDPPFQGRPGLRRPSAGSEALPMRQLPRPPRRGATGDV
jgi:hypothetical protein